jgi:uncharacterized damage-inducible protein DinB
MFTHRYVQLIEIKRWADAGLYGAVAAHRPSLSDTDAGLLRQVLDHMHVVDRIFRAHLTGAPHAFTAARSEVLPSFEALEARVRETDDWYGAYVAGLAETAFDELVDFVFTSGKPARMTRGEIVLHVCLHGTTHRGQAGALLQLRGLAPSRDSITDWLEDTGRLQAA